ncbi:unnamed protein product, partial [Mesorhabditis belari]|uniref:Uncharacterized protein n=1 Tax=Mesorhabditis belari TaxID=2138241 RepID=A0AAF3J997_9BILA
MNLKFPNVVHDVARKIRSSKTISTGLSNPICIKKPFCEMNSAKHVRHSLKKKPWGAKGCVSLDTSCDFEIVEMTHKCKK